MFQQHTHSVTKMKLLRKDFTIIRFIIESFWMQWSKFFGFSDKPFKNCLALQHCKYSLSESVSLN